MIHFMASDISFQIVDSGVTQMCGLQTQNHHSVNGAGSSGKLLTLSEAQVCYLWKGAKRTTVVYFYGLKYR